MKTRSKKLRQTEDSDKKRLDKPLDCSCCSSLDKGLHSILYLYKEIIQYNSPDHPVTMYLVFMSTPHLVCKKSQQDKITKSAKLLSTAKVISHLKIIGFGLTHKSRIVNRTLLSNPECWWNHRLLCQVIHESGQSVLIRSKFRALKKLKTV